jgi:hypothetical protein
MAKYQVHINVNCLPEAREGQETDPRAVDSLYGRDGMTLTRTVEAASEPEAVAVVAEQIQKLG